MGMSVVSMESVVTVVVSVGIGGSLAQMGSRLVGVTTAGVMLS